jgi:hypothetical protein
MPSPFIRYDFSCIPEADVISPVKKAVVPLGGAAVYRCGRGPGAPSFAHSAKGGIPQKHHPRDLLHLVLGGAAPGSPARPVLA